MRELCGMSSVSSPELLAPAGNRDCARAAVANGADAVYFGLSAFNARIRADNFCADDLPALMRFLHDRGVRGYLALNTLVFTGELPAAEEMVQAAQNAGVDALIVQDLGLVRLARAVAPGLEIHASTQMTITSPEGVHFAKSMGVDRVVVARELSLRELEKFRADDAAGLPLEVFVHGALCVAYSGQCLTSESMGQRSANRGECAQACRLPYDLIVDGEARELGDRRYLLSPQDLAAIDDVPALIDAGIGSFKIEGRLKSPEYVAAITQVYRQAIDRAVGDRGAYQVSSDDHYRLEMTFSRGLFSGWIHGVDHQRLVHARFGKKRGPLAGTVRRVGGDFVEFAPETPLRPGDGVVFDTGGNPDNEQGGRIYEIRGEQFSFQRGRIDFTRLAPGHRVWKTSDPALERELRRTFAGDIPVRDRAVTFVVRGAANDPLRAEARHAGLAVAAVSASCLQPAHQRPLTAAVLREHFARLGGTGFSLAAIETELSDDLFLPLRELNDVRRQCIAALSSELVRRSNRTAPVVAVTARVPKLLETVEKLRQKATPAPVRLAVLCRSMEQIEAALGCHAQTIYVDFEDIRRYPEAVRLAQGQRDSQLLLATPRIQKAGEQGFFKLIEDAAPAGVLIRNLGGLDFFRHSTLLKVGDFSLNVANPLTAQLLMERGFDALTVSYDLNHQQVTDLLTAAPAEWFEVTIHQHMPLFHMEHCVYAAFLSSGHTHLDCGRPCEKHSIQLRDRLGVAHPVKVDVGCRNTVYHARAQSGAGFLDDFVARGLRRVRIELVDEDAGQARFLIESYQRLLRGEFEPGELVRQLKVVAQLGVTDGTLAVMR